MKLAAPSIVRNRKTSNRLDVSVGVHGDNVELRMKIGDTVSEGRIPPAEALVIAKAIFDKAQFIKVRQALRSR